jgi:hypothetical protein
MPIFAGQQIPNLPLTTALGGTEEFECVQAGVSSRTTLALIAAYVMSVAGSFFNVTLGGTTLASRINLTPSTAPAAPSTGWTFYVDSGDSNKLKAKASNGTIVTLGTP